MCGRGPLQSPWGLKNWLVSLQFCGINNVCTPPLVVVVLHVGVKV